MMLFGHYMYLPHSVTFRITDIWRGYWCQPLLWLINSTLGFHAATAYQYRNPHSYLKDFKEEDDLYKKTDDLLELLHQWKCEENKVFKDCIIELSKLMAENGFWSEDEADHIEVWLDVLTSVGYKFPLRVNKTNITNNFIPVLFQPKVEEFVQLQNDEFSKVDINDFKKKKQIEFLKDKCFNLSFIDYGNILKHDESKLSNLTQTTLLISFNKQVFIENIQYLFAMYADYFQRIIFCGKNVIEILRSIKDDMRIYLSGIDLDLGEGFYHYDCMTKAVQMRINTRGILYISDDSLVKPWNVRNLSLDKIWFIRPILGLTLLNDTKHVKNWWCWSTSMGRAAVLQTFSGFNNEKKEKTLMDNYFHNFADATGSDFIKNEIYIPATGSDIFYLPKKFFHSFQLIAGICRYSNLNLEIAVPVVLYGLDGPNNTELLSVNINGISLTKNHSKQGTIHLMLRFIQLSYRHLRMK
jgi:hypothetical protein